MIQAKFYYKLRGSVHLVIRGHAGAAPRGKDPICAGVSALACTAAQTVTDLYRQGMLRCRPKVILEDGYACIIATPRREYLGEVMLTYWVIQTGLRVIAANFPGFVCLQQFAEALNPDDQEKGWNG